VNYPVPPFGLDLSFVVVPFTTLLPLRVAVRGSIFNRNL
jgi:hypothetical protein